MALTVTIGRNIGTVPMSETDWEGFVASTLANVRTLSPAIYFAGFGQGEWEGEPEQSFCIVAEEISYNDASLLKFRLQGLAHQYGQDAIALTNGATTFAYPAPARA